MNGYFITGTDTGVGKTIASAVITLAHQAYYWKPIQSALAEDLADSAHVQHLTGLQDKNILPSTYALQAVLSPNQAAALEGINIDIKNCKIPAEKSPLIIEGIGGIFVPICEKTSVLDLMQQYNLPVIVVARGTLGTINHTLMTIEILRQRHIKMHGIIFSGTLNPENKNNIETRSGVKTLFHIPHFENLNQNILQNWVKENRKEIIEACPCL
jgi:dethiobiotin synthetase